MKREVTHYEAVQVVLRNSSGRLTEWWPADIDERRASEKEAREDAKKLAKEYQKEYSVIRTSISELASFGHNGKCETMQEET